MSHDDSTVLARLEALPQEARFVRLELQGPSLNQRLPLMRQVTRFELTSGTWTCRWNEDGSFTFRKDQERLDVQLGEAFTLDGQAARMLDLRTLAPFSLCLKREGEPDRRWELSDGVHFIGRPGKRKNRISFTHQSVSRAHARIEIANQTAVLVAESSAGLTALNGRRIAADASETLRSGDRIQLGENLCWWQQESLPPLTPDPSGLVVQVLGGLRVWKDGQEMTLRNEKARVIFSWLLVRNEATVPLEKLLESLWPERTLLRQRKNLSHAMKMLQADLDLSDQDFERVFPRSADSLRLEPERLARVDLWVLQRACQEAETAQLAALHPAPLLPELSEEWVESARCEHFLSWLKLVRKTTPPSSLRPSILDAISNSLSGTEFPEFVYQEALALAQEWESPQLAKLWCWDYQNRIGTISESDLVE